MPGTQEIIVILIVIAVIFGASKLPQIGDGLGKAIKNFKKSVKDVEDATDITPTANEKERINHASSQSERKTKERSKSTKKS